MATLIKNIPFVHLISSFIPSFVPGFILIPMLMAGCSNNSLPDYVKLGELRILTLKLDTPEASPGDTVKLTPVISDLNGKGRSLTYTVQTCPDPGVSFGLEAKCSVPDTTLGPLAVGALTPNDATYTGLAPTFSVSVPQTLLNQESLQNKTNGVAYLILYTLTASDGATVTALKRVLVSLNSKSNKNTNPIIRAITGNSVALQTTPLTNALPSAAVPLKATLSTEERIDQLKNDGSTQTSAETLVTTWFYTDGSTQYFRTIGSDSTQWTPPSSKPAGRPVSVVGVTRDGRGGVDFQILQFQ